MPKTNLRILIASGAVASISALATSIGSTADSGQVREALQALGWSIHIPDRVSSVKVAYLYRFDGSEFITALHKHRNKFQDLSNDEIVIVLSLDPKISNGDKLQFALIRENTHLHLGILSTDHSVGKQGRYFAQRHLSPAALCRIAELSPVYRLRTTDCDKRDFPEQRARKLEEQGQFEAAATFWIKKIHDDIPRGNNFGRAWQKYLKEFGHYTGEADGKYDERLSKGIISCMKYPAC